MAQHQSGTTASYTGDSAEALPYLYTPACAAEILSIKESWLRRQAGRRMIPCTFVGRHLRFSVPDLQAIAEHGAYRPATRQHRHQRHRT